MSKENDHIQTQGATMRQAKPTEADTESCEIHDHFDGSANCVECRGECKLRGADRIATELIRWMFESWKYQNGFPTDLHKSTLKKAGVDFDAFMTRCIESSSSRMPKIDALGIRRSEDV